MIAADQPWHTVSRKRTFLSVFLGFMSGAIRDLFLYGLSQSYCGAEKNQLTTYRDSIKFFQARHIQRWFTIASLFVATQDFLGDLLAKYHPSLTPLSLRSHVLLAFTY